MGFPGDSDGEKLHLLEGNLSLILELQRSPGEGNDYPLQYVCLEKNTSNNNNNAKRSLMGYCPWGHEELDMID